MENNGNFRLILFTGASGAGKTDILNYCLEHYPERVIRFKTTTTREARSEQDLKDYYLEQLAQFQKMQKQNDFFESEEVFPGRFYGYTKDELRRISGAGKIAIAAVDVNGALKFIGKQPSTETSFVDLGFVKPTVIFISASREELVGRLTKAYESGERKGGVKELNDRITRLDYELSQQEHFENVIFNHDGKFEFAANEAVNKILYPVVA